MMELLKKHKIEIKNCIKCGKVMDRKGTICYECRVRSRYKARIKVMEEDKRIDREIMKMKPELKKKLHDELLKELLEEQNGKKNILE